MLLIHAYDNVEIDLTNGHKYSNRDIKCGESIIKYGSVIGHATEDIPCGAHVHTHNLATDLADTVTYTYQPSAHVSQPSHSTHTFLGYKRKDGRVGVRNDVWIVNTVGCVNGIARQLAEKTGALAFPHPFGCSQLGDDMANTQKILRGMVNHPNAAGVLVLGLGCENNNIDEFKKALGEYDPERVRFLNCQDTEDELTEGVRLIAELKAYAATFTPTPCPASDLVVGLKCGGSDGYSGITANPLVGRFCDALTREGGSCLLTEVPEMFGAEHLLMARATDRAVFDRIVDLINDCKSYYKAHGQVIYENPAPGNKAGGITTLEEKSLGCVQKGGTSPVVDVLHTGETVRRKGLSLLDGPGNDMVAVTNLVAAGAQIILFTTGRGTPLGAPVPTVKIATNRALAEKKPGWIDFDASPVLEGISLDGDFFEYVLQVASGKETANERRGMREISIFKDGVTL
ncbi:MAG: altronate dehydratase [Ruminococcaceae bacterium]|nr:altronate dehydratase [Oscillospiraceae bacterium]